MCSSITIIKIFIGDKLECDAGKRLAYVDGGIIQEQENG